MEPACWHVGSPEVALEGVHRLEVAVAPSAQAHLHTTSMPSATSMLTPHLVNCMLRPVTLPPKAAAGAAVCIGNTEQGAKTRQHSIHLSQVTTCSSRRDRCLS